jgi:glycosyltransferase involved in cell wall biosynthesis
MRLNVTLPCLNEEKILPQTVAEVYGRLGEDFPDGDWVLVAVDSGSTDGTRRVAEALLAEYPRLRLMKLDRQGKGLAVRSGWRAHPADVNVFIDADLVTDLAALKPLVEAVENGADVALGSRYLPGSVVERSAWRRLFSLSYRLLFRLRLRLSVSDAACGFKAVNRRVLERIVPQVRSDLWFFDTELLARASHAGFRLAEIPVQWRQENVKGRGSKVNVLRVSWQYLREVERVRRELK